MIDPGHGGIDNGTRAPSGENEKAMVLDFALALRDKIEKTGKYRVLMTRSDDTFIPLNERVHIARSHKASLFISIHADALVRRDPSAQGVTVYTVSERASDPAAARLAEAENRADVIAGLDLSAEPRDVADILIDLARRETKTFSVQFARTLITEMRPPTKLHQNPIEIGRLPRAQGARRALGPGRTRLRDQQGRRQGADVRDLARTRGGRRRAGDRCLFHHPSGRRAQLREAEGRRVLASVST